MRHPLIPATQSTKNSNIFSVKSLNTFMIFHYATNVITSNRIIGCHVVAKMGMTVNNEKYGIAWEFMQIMLTLYPTNSAIMFTHQPHIST